MNFILVDGHNRDHLLPFTFTRPVAHLRLGILTLQEKWNKLLNKNCSVLTEDYLMQDESPATGDERTYIDASIIPDANFVKQLSEMKPDSFILKENIVVACRCTKQINNEEFKNLVPDNNVYRAADSTVVIKYPWDIFSNNARAIADDIQLIQQERKWIRIADNNNIIGADRVFIEEGVQMNFATINAMEGPVFIGKNAIVMEGTLIRGPFALCEESVLKMGTKIYGGTTIGPHCKVGGEVNNSVFIGYSNKAHDGFLGNSVIGEWCNIGADTNNSNLKNNYGNVRVWNYKMQDYIDSGRQFCGLFMGDHAKAGINTMFNTGTVVGVSANVFGSGFPPKHIPSFSWGGAEGFERFKLDKALEVASAMYNRRSVAFDHKEQSILQHLYSILH